MLSVTAPSSPTKPRDKAARGEATGGERATDHDTVRAFDRGVRVKRQQAAGNHAQAIRTPGNVSAPVVCKLVVEVVSTPVIVTVSPRSTTLSAIPSLPTV